MKRALLIVAFAGIFSSCVHPWIGRPVTQLRKEMGRPLRIHTDGTNEIYVYRDTLAGRGVMTFTVDSQGIIRDWDATTNVPGPFGDDIFGTDDANSLSTIPQP